MTDDTSEQRRLDELAGDSSSHESANQQSPSSKSSSTGKNAARSTPTAVEETVELGVSLLAHLETDECSLADAIDRIETVTTDPALTREILDRAELRGHIAREDGTVRIRSGSFVRFERDVVKRTGEFTCRRCGASISTGHFIRFDAGEHGPFGSSCIRKVTGRE